MKTRPSGRLNSFHLVIDIIMEDQMSHKTDRAIVVFLAFGLLGCRSAPIEVVAPPIAGLNGDESRTSVLETGRAIYTSKCTKCHKAKPVGGYSSEDWSSRIMPKMARRAKLTPGESDATLAYVLAIIGSKLKVDGE